MNQFLESIFFEEDINKICKIFDQESIKFDRSILFVFDIFDNIDLKDFSNKNIYKYSIIGISNYNRAYILDNRYSAKESRTIGFSRTINLDLNILTYLKNIINGKEINEKSEFLSYLQYLKEKEYNLNMSTSLIERISKPVNEKIWSEYILSFVKYETLDTVTEEKLQTMNTLPEEKYKWAESILNKSNYTGEYYNQYYIVVCLVMKAFILRLEQKETSKKMLNLLEYALKELEVYAELELYILGKYLLKDEDVKKTFEKIEGFSKDTVSRLKNTAWDIFHIRMIERLMLNDLREGKIIFSYIGTRDVGLKDIININPIKVMGILDNQNIIIRKYNLMSLFDNIDEFDKMLQKYKTKNSKTQSGTINYKDKINSLINEISNRQDEMFN
ncbi:MAG: hypothetical protein ACTJGH_03015 [Peptoniphilaceae bacterium]